MVSWNTEAAWPLRRGARIVAVAALGLLLAACATDRVGEAMSGAAAGETGAYGTTMRIADATRAVGDLTGAVSLYRRAAEIAPKRAAPLVALGGTLQDARAFNESVTAYQAALAIEPKNVDALRGLGNSFVGLDQAQLALTQFRAAAQFNPADPRLANSLGVVYDMLSDHRAAQESYAAGLASTPDNLPLLNNLSLSLALSGDFDQAVARLRPVALSAGSTLRTRQTLALIYGLANNSDAAARIARMDLDESAVQSNLAYYTTLRGLVAAKRSSAIVKSSVRSDALP